MADLMESPYNPEEDPSYFQSEASEYLRKKGVKSVADLEKLFEPSYYVVIPVDILESTKLSATAKLVYAEICALSRRSGYCFASNGHLADMTGNSQRTITRAVTELAKAKLIILQMSTSPKGIHRNIVVSYGLDKMARPPSQSVQTPLAKVSRVEIKTYRNNNKTPAPSAEETMQDKNINDFISQFKKINPAYGQLFKRKNQREAAARLLKMKTWDVWLQFFAAYSIQIQRDTYCPTATTPMELESKLGKISAYISKLKVKGMTENKKAASRLVD